MASLSLSGGSQAWQGAEVYSVDLGGCATKTGQSWRQGRYVYLSVAQVQSHLSLKMQPSEGSWILLLAPSWKVFSLTS